MIHAFALEPSLVATWGRREEFRFVQDKFGLGTPRVFLELPRFSRWKRDVYAVAKQLELSQEDMKRVEELFRLFAEHKCRRIDAVHDGLITWLENAEREYNRKPFAGILAATNPRVHAGVLTGDELGPRTPRWAFDLGATPDRTPEALAVALSAMLTNCRQIHIVDPYFGPANARHRNVLEALMNVVVVDGHPPGIVRVHCSAKEEIVLRAFEEEAAAMARHLPKGVAVEFVRWRQRRGGEKLHNRFVLTDIGGVNVGIGIEAGKAGETDDLNLMSRAQYQKRWSQYVAPGDAFDCVDRPATVIGTKPRRPGRAGGDGR